MEELRNRVVDVYPARDVLMQKNRRR